MLGEVPHEGLQVPTEGRQVAHQQLQRLTPLLHPLAGSVCLPARWERVCAGLGDAGLLQGLARAFRIGRHHRRSFQLSCEVILQLQLQLSGVAA